MFGIYIGSAVEVHQFGMQPQMSSKHIFSHKSGMNAATWIITVEFNAVDIHVYFTLPFIPVWNRAHHVRQLQSHPCLIVHFIFSCNPCINAHGSFISRNALPFVIHIDIEEKRPDTHMDDQQEFIRLVSPDKGWPDIHDTLRFLVIHRLIDAWYGYIISRGACRRKIGIQTQSPILNSLFVLFTI